MSDHDFADKRDSAKGFHFSPLRLNEGLGQLDSWNMEEIKQRGERLAQKAVTIWRAPQPNADMIERYQVEHGKGRKSQQTEYTIEHDHRDLIEGPMAETFRYVDSTIRSWDPHIERRTVKQYVGYHDNQMFALVISRKERIIIGLAMPFEHLHDERQLVECRDSRGWGGVRIEVSLYPSSSKEDVEYVLNLVRQSYEDQLDE